MKYLFTLLITILITACASVPGASEDADKEAKKFLPPKSGLSSLYITRAGLMGQTSVLELSINGLIAAKTSPRTYVKFELPPGRYYITTRGENINQIEVELKKGETKYINQSVVPGWNDFRTDIQNMAEKEGKEAVLNSKMVQKLMRDSDIKQFKN
jgi:hypothetical protein